MFARVQLLRQEKGVLGQYVTDHPLLHVKDRLDAQTDTSIVDIPESDGEVVTVGGIVGAVRLARSTIAWKLGASFQASLVSLWTRK